MHIGSLSRISRIEDGDLSKMKNQGSRIGQSFCLAPTVAESDVEYCPPSRLCLDASQKKAGAAQPAHRGGKPGVVSEAGIGRQRWWGAWDSALRQALLGASGMGDATRTEAGAGADWAWFVQLCAFVRASPSPGLWVWVPSNGWISNKRRLQSILIFDSPSNSHAFHTLSRRPRPSSIIAADVSTDTALLAFGTLHHDF
ncbi:hypothetical protein GGTG_10921 [Gaeumannomyces tritici R3-111a-1]|uniref:Uncharacterized protein n=1 Tax=Gaeumannomyces tritici (strain R3-111a-1) TaxID=644352 RepID=J3PBQ0_GAET3|nr:hypothetical protein GGTG_10921 [Gaeumannomyces tritici R3-111a-1]EJT71667.1 hypothetical protein GGTG_10921 [Gaeumannomyces tritici R3-111a-1]